MYLYVQIKNVFITSWKSWPHIVSAVPLLIHAPPAHFTIVGFKPLCYANYVIESGEFFLWYCSVCRISLCSIMGLTSPQYPLHLGLWGLFLLYFFILKDILGCKDSLLLLLSESLEGTLSYCACTNYIACETFTL